MKNKYRILKIIFVVGVLIFLLNFSLNRFSSRPLDKIVVKMIQNQPVSFIDEQDVKEIIYQLTPSKKVGELDISNIERKLSENPVIDSANVYLKLNGELNLHIVQRIPIFRLSKKEGSFYIDEKGVEFPVSVGYSHPCILVSGNVEKEEYPMLIQLVEKINRDNFSKNFFVGISKIGRDYYLITNNGEYRVELGNLENIDFKINGFKTFVEKYLIYQEPHKYSKISVKYDNQVVTTLREAVEDLPEVSSKPKPEKEEEKPQKEEPSKEQVKKEEKREVKKEEKKEKSKEESKHKPKKPKPEKPKEEVKKDKKK